MTDPDMSRPAPTEAAFRRRVVFTGFVVLGLVALAAAAWALRTLVLMTFLAVILAVLLSEIAHILHRKLGMGRRWAVLLVVAVLALAAGAAAAFLAPTLVDQARQLVQKLPEAASGLQKRLGDHPWLESLWGQVSSGLSLPEPSEAMGHAGRILAGISGSLGYAGLVFGAALFLALEPDLYRRGFVRLVPVRHRAFADDLLDELERTIVSWLGAQLILMAFIGAMVALGLWIIGVPYALALGLLAGLLEFIPYLGPILSSVPAILIALSTDMTTALWTLGLVVGVQQVENNVLQPLVQKSQVDIPPVLLIVVLFGMGALFGVPGILVATPLLAVVMVVVRRIYIERILEGGAAAPHTAETPRKSA